MTILNIKQNFKSIGNKFVSPSQSKFNQNALSAFNNNPLPNVEKAKTKLTITVSNSGSAASGPIVSSGIINNLNSQLTQPDPQPGSSNTSTPQVPTIAPIIPIQSGSNATNNTPISGFFNPIPPPEGNPSLNDPSLAPNAEESSGVTLSPEEKPAIVGIMSDNIENGIPQKNIIFIKGLTSFNKKVKKYIVYKKDLLNNTNFIKIFERAPQDITQPENFKELVKQNPALKAATFGIEDLEINNNSVFIYKVYIEWIQMTADEISNIARSRFSRDVLYDVGASGRFIIPV